VTKWGLRCAHRPPREAARRPPPAHAVQPPPPHTALRPSSARSPPPPHPPPNADSSPTAGSTSTHSLAHRPEALLPPPKLRPPSSFASPPPPHPRGDRCDPHRRASPLEAGGGGGCGLVGDVHTALTVADSHSLHGVLAAIRSLLVHSGCPGGLLLHLLLPPSDDGAPPWLWPQASRLWLICSLAMRLLPRST
jgi:hypothetical protein